MLLTVLGELSSSKAFRANVVARSFNNSIALIRQTIHVSLTLIAHSRAIFVAVATMHRFGFVKDIWSQCQTVVYAAYSLSVLFLSLQDLHLLLRRQRDLMLAHKIAVDVWIDVVVDETQELEVLVHP
jgi:uncharacterized membrane protein YhaH (DUF805 family)